MTKEPVERRRSTDTRTEELTEAVNEMTARIEALAGQSRRHRTQVVVLTLSVLFDLILSIAFFVSLESTNDAQDKTEAVVAEIEKIGNVARVTCLAANDSATKQHQLWEGVIASTDSDPAEVEAFRKNLDATFPQQDCDK